LSDIAIPKARLLDILDEMQKKYTLVAPVRNGNILDFAVVKEAKTVELSDDITYKSPKEYLFPQTEKMFCFTGDGDLVTAEDIPQTVLLGIKPCDLEAIKIMTAVFTKGKYVDNCFAKRLERTILIGMGCQAAKKACFCDERAVDKSASTACDVFLTDMGDHYVAEVFSEKGRLLLSGCGFDGICVADAAESKGPAGSEGLLEINAKENDLFKKIDWEILTEKCLGCGMCTYICPTCHCFGFKDVEEKGDVTRYKCWDSCMYPNFTNHASGHNPRASKLERFRQRVMHKYLYVKQNFGYIACTGCGRCIRSCPAGMNIRSVVKAVNNSLAEGGEV